LQINTIKRMQAQAAGIDGSFSRLR